MDNIKDLRTLECKHENTELLEVDLIEDTCTVKCTDCGHIMKFMGVKVEKYECVPDEIPCLEVKVSYPEDNDDDDYDPECWDGGYVDFEGDIAP